MASAARPQRKVLIVAAHPDDEVLGCGGAAAAHCGSGDQVAVLILGEGITSRGATRLDADGTELSTLRKDARLAANVIGVTDLTLLSFPDNRFDSVDLLEIVKAIESEKSRVRPDLVYVHHWGDLNIDHRRTFDAVMAAFRPLPGEPAVDIYAYETPSATGWAGPGAGDAFIPTHYVAIDGTLDKKVAAMESYSTERRAWPHPRGPEALRAWAAYRGSQVGLTAAEAFATVRTIAR